MPGFLLPSLSSRRDSKYAHDLPPQPSVLLLMKTGKQWNNFIGSYSRESWSSLRSTEQTRKFTAYFMSKVIESDGTSYKASLEQFVLDQCSLANHHKANKSFFLSFWMSSLVERESLLKHQNRFTNVLLNHDHDNPILRNLPFWTNRGSDGYSITALEFRARRLSLISCKFIVPFQSYPVS
jgi:hypothetical protein